MDRDGCEAQGMIEKNTGGENGGARRRGRKGGGGGGLIGWEEDSTGAGRGVWDVGCVGVRGGAEGIGRNDKQR